MTIRNLVLLTLSLLLPGCVPYSTDSTEVGVHVNLVTGLDSEVYPPGGTYFFAPFITDWYTFSTQAQTLKMTAALDANEGDSRDDLEFKTKDGNDVAVDVTVIYRIIPTRAQALLQRVAVSDADLKDRILRPLARSIVRDVLNELSSEDIYAGKKFEAADRARLALNAALEAYGVQCDNVILADHRFHERYQKAINDKKINDQLVNTNRSKSENIKREWEAKLEAAKGQVERTIAEEQGKSQQMKLDADAYYVRREKEAEAIVAEKAANAQAIREMNEALSGSGGRVMVKRKIAETLKGKRIVALPGGQGGVGVQKLDLNALISAYGLADPAPNSSQPPPR